MASGHNDIVLVEGLELRKETERAFGVLAGGGGELIWLAKSLVEEHSLAEGDEHGWAKIPRWIAEEKELDYSEE